MTVDTKIDAKLKQSLIKAHVTAGGSEKLILFKESTGAQEYAFERDAIILAREVNNPDAYGVYAGEFEQKYSCRVVSSTKDDPHNLKAIAIDLPDLSRHIAIAGAEDISANKANVFTRFVRWVKGSNTADLEVLPTQFESAKNWLSQLKNTANYFGVLAGGQDKQLSESISLSGHLRGGLVAQVLAAEFINQGQKVVSAKVFKALGPKECILKASQENLFTKNEAGTECKVDDLLKEVRGKSELFIKSDDLVKMRCDQLGHINLVCDATDQVNSEEQSPVARSALLCCWKNMRSPTKPPWLLAETAAAERANANSVSAFGDDAQIISVLDLPTNPEAEIIGQQLNVLHAEAPTLL